MRDLINIINENSDLEPFASDPNWSASEFISRVIDILIFDNHTTTDENVLVQEALTAYLEPLLKRNRG